MSPELLQKLSHALLQTSCNGASREKLCCMAKAATRILMWVETDGQDVGIGSHRTWRNKLRDIYTALGKAVHTSPSTSDCALMLKAMLDISAETVAVITPDERDECEMMADHLVTNHLERLKGYTGKVDWTTQTALLDLIILLYTYLPDPDEPAFCFLQDRLQESIQRISSASLNKKPSREETAANIALVVRYRNAFLDKTYDAWLSDAIQRHIEAPVEETLNRIDSIGTSAICTPTQLASNEVRFLCTCQEVMSECHLAPRLTRTTQRLGHLFLQQSHITPPETDLSHQVRTQAILQGIAETMTAARLSICCSC